MPQYQTISQAIFDSKAKEAIARTPIRKEVNLKEIEIIKNDVLRLGDTHIKMSNDAFKGICKIVGLPVGFDKTFSSAFGDKARQALVNRLKIAVQAKGATTLSLVVNPENKQIIGVQKDPRDLVSNQTFLDTSSAIINKYGLEVNNFSVGSNGGVVINTSSPKNSWGIKGLADEDFYGGVTFVNNPDGGFRVSPYLHRLVCANGMIGTAFDETFSLGQMDARYMESFWTQLNSLAERGFRPAKFEDRVRLASNTRASLFELESVHDTLKFLSDAEHKELEAWAPLHTTRASFHAANIDTILLSTSQKKGARTGTSIWDLVNGMTHFATHDNGFKIDDYDRRKIQVQASQLLSKAYDMENIIASPFK
jgi:hypothetical protein